jgi:hypothetical protein
MNVVATIQLGYVKEEIHVRAGCVAELVTWLGSASRVRKTA